MRSKSTTKTEVDNKIMILNHFHNFAVDQNFPFAEREKKTWRMEVWSIEANTVKPRAKSLQLHLSCQVQCQICLYAVSKKPNPQKNEGQFYKRNFSQSVVTSTQVEKVTFPLGLKKGQTISFLANSFKKGQMASQTSSFTVLTIHITF